MKTIVDKLKNYTAAIYAILLFLAVGLGFALLGSDMQTLLRWDLGLFALNLAVLPLIGLLFKEFNSRAYLFGRVIGLCLSSYIVWLLSSLHLLAFSNSSVIGVTLVILVICYGLYFVKNKDKTLDLYNYDLIILYEFAFLFILIISTWVLAHKIPATETERLMDYAFMATMDKTSYMPPLDTWAAGECINYYYYGQYMMTFLCKLSFVPVCDGYSLALTTILTIGLCYVYLIVNMLTVSLSAMKGYACKIAGAISAIAVMLSGNVHYIIYGKIVPAISDIFGLEGNTTYWFADSTRYIGYRPLNEADRTISEFPSYSFLIGDLHAHVINIIVVLTIIAVIIAYAYDMWTDDAREDRGIAREIPSILLNANLIICIFLIAISSMSNYWDFAIYFVVSGAFVLVSLFIRYRSLWKTFLYTFIEGAFFWIGINLFNYPFRSKFNPMFDGIGIVEIRTLPYQLLVLWGLPIACVILLVAFCFSKGLFSDKNKLFEFSDIYIILISLCAIGLVAVPEFIFVKDIYINGFPRANTMFKMTYEAYILFGICMGYIFVRVLSATYSEELSVRQFVRARSIKRWAGVLLVIWIFTVGYLFSSLRAWIGEYKTWEYKGINSMTTTLDNIGDESEVVDWIIDNIKGQEIILVSDGLSYSDYDVIPAMTGHPTVLGWMTHEWLWHNSYDYVLERQNDIKEIYTGEDLEKKEELINKYNIEYIYIGTKEFEKYGDVRLDILSSMGDIAYYGSSTSSYLIRVTK